MLPGLLDLGVPVGRGVVDLGQLATVVGGEVVGVHVLVQRLHLASVEEELETESEQSERQSWSGMQGPHGRNRI